MAMKFVLLSPVIVLVLWSIGAMMFSRRAVQKSPAAGAVRKPVRPKHRTREAFLGAVEVAEDVFGRAQPKPRPEPREEAQYPMYMASRDINVVRPRPGPSPRGPLIVQPGTLMQAQPNMMNSQPVMMNAQPAMQITSNFQPHMMETQPHMMNAQSVMMNSQPQMMESQPQMMQSQPQMMQEQPQMMQTLGREQPHLRKGNTKIFYYDPRAAMSLDGNIALPEIVYDQYGKPHELSQIKTKELLLQPPMGVHHFNVSSNGTAPLNITYNHPNVISNKHEHSRNQYGYTMTNPAATMQESSGSSRTDQSIIVCTVGTIALLIGAVSARKLRARSFLSSCIENESLEDEIAFDNAYTVNSEAAYNTFQNWKNDLEKFDV